MGNFSAGVKEQRNLEIYRALQDGKEVGTLASAYHLSPRTVRDISKRMTEKYASGNGAKPRPSAVGEIGKTGLRYDGYGRIHEEFLSELNSPDRRYKIFNEMRQNSSVIGPLLLAIKLPICGVEWRFEGEGGDSRVDFLNDALGDMSHSVIDHIAEALTMLPFGFSIFETVYKRRDDGKIGWQKMAFRSQDSLHSWQLDENGALTGFTQQPWPSFKVLPIPAEKLVLYRTTTEKGNPEGQSILRPAYVPYYYVKNLQAVEAIGAERDLAGLPMIKLPQDADTSEGSTDLSNAEKIVRRVRNDEQAGAVIPFGWDFSLLGSPGAKQVNIDEIIQRYEKRMAMSALAQFLMLGMDQVGSYSLGKDHSDFFLMAVTAFADIIADTYTKTAAVRLLALNGMETKNPPKLTHGALNKIGLQEISDAISKLAPTGFLQPDDEFEKWLRQLLNAPELTDEIIEERKARQSAPKPAAPGQADPTGQPPDKPGDGEMMMDGDPAVEEMLKKMSLKQQTAFFATSSSGVRQRIKQIPDDRTRKAILKGSKDLVDLNRDLMKQKLDALKGITDEEWQQAVEKDAEKERANGSHP